MIPGIVVTEIVIVFALGLVAGSFLNVVIIRLASREKIARGRSHCRHCKETLKGRDLIPVFSYLFLLGKCRNCKKSISWQYPAVELATGLLFVLIASRTADVLSLETLRNSAGLGLHYIDLIWNPFVIALMLAFFHVSVLVVLFVYDLKHQLLPNKVLWPAIVVAVVTLPVDFFRLETENHWWHYFLAAAVAGGFFWLLHAVSKGKWIGFGDVKLALYMGLLVGWPNILFALLFAFVSGALVAVGLMLAGKKQWGERVPFGVFLTASVIATWWFGNAAVGWYLGLF